MDFLDQIRAQLETVYQSDGFPFVCLGVSVGIVYVSTDWLWILPGVGLFLYFQFWKTDR